MNLSNQRKSIQSTLINASSIIEIAMQEGMTDIELLSAIDLIKNHKEKATAATVADSTIIDFGSVNLKSLILTTSVEKYAELKDQGNIGVLFEPSILTSSEIKESSNFYLIGILKDI